MLWIKKESADEEGPDVKAGQKPENCSGGFAGGRPGRGAWTAICHYGGNYHHTQHPGHQAGDFSDCG